MKKIWYLSGALLVMSCFSGCQDKREQEITINVHEKGSGLSESMYGIFFEEINHAGDGGLYAELVRNRSFEELEMPEGYTVKDGKLFAAPVADHITGKVNNRSYGWTKEKIPGWKLLPDDPGIIAARLTKFKPKHISAPNNVEINVLDSTRHAVLVNEGYWGMGITEGEKYVLRIILRTDKSCKGNLKVKLVGNNDNILDSNTFALINNGEWNEYNAVMTAKSSDAKGKLTLEFKSIGKVWIDYVSLFPEKTFNNRANGLRKDISDFLVGLKPSFVRWPGGCVVEGITLNNRFEWKKTLGDPAARSGEYSTWGYRCSYGFGYHEFLQFCEDIRADAMFVCNVGLACQWRGGEACSASDIDFYLKDVMDAVEYALGDSTTGWGAKRVAAGHPGKFPMKYVEIGNENWGDEYDKRFDIFYKAIKEKYPQLVLISNHGMAGTDKIVKTDMIDPHWYAIPEFFLNNADIFDASPREKYKVYVGEYACNRSVGGGNMLAALSEAAFLTGMERNGDLVTMSSFAPLLENKFNREWPVNLIWFDSRQVLGRSSYYVQKMFADHKPDYTVKSSFTTSEAIPKPLIPGYLAVKTLNTGAEYKDIELINPAGQNLRTADPFNYQLVKDGEYVLKFKAKRNNANQGLQIFLGEKKDGKTGFLFSIGRHGSSSVVAQYYMNSNMIGYVGYGRNVAIDNNKWYEVRVSVISNKVNISLNDEPVLNFTSQDYPRQFMSTGYDKQTGEIIIKMVNVGSKEFFTNIILDGVTKTEKTGKVIVLAADSLNAENSFENPKRIAPVISSHNNFNTTFNYQFKPYSLTVLRIKATL